MIESITPSQTPVRFAIYARISSDKTGAGLGVERQIEECQELVDRLGGEVVAIHSDNDISAYSGKPRPGYDALCEAVRSGQCDAVAVWHQDRLLRRNIDLEGYIAVCEPMSVPTYTVRAGTLDLSTPSGRAIARTLAAWASYEVETATSRVKAAKLQSAKAGRHQGGNRPFGYSKDGMTIVKEEAAVLRQMAERLLIGDSYRTIALALNEQGILTTKGRPWRSLKVSQTLFRKRNFGIREHLGREYPAAWPAIFDDETAAKLYLAQAGRSALRLSRGRGRVHLLKGFLFCGICGNGLTVYSCQQRSGSHIPAVACRSRDDVIGIKGCGGVKRNLPPIDHLITEAVLFRLDSDAMSALLARQGNPNVLKYVAEQRAQQARLDEVLDRYAKGELDFDEYRIAKATATTELERLSKKVERVSGGSPLADVNGQGIRQAWETHGIEWKRQVLNLLIDKIIVHPRPKDPTYRTPRWGKGWFDPALIEVRWKA